jgi:hypothetical protein
MYLVKKEKLIKLIAAYYKLQALEAGGVDNWSWYSDSLNDFLREVMPNNLDEDEYWDYGFEGFAEDMISNFGNELITNI